MKRIRREIKTIESEYMNMNIPLAIYGHYGINIMYFTNFSDDHLEAEKKGLVSSLERFIKKGKIKLICVPSLLSQSWYNTELSMQERSEKHFDYNGFTEEEVLPEIYTDSGQPVPVFTAGFGRGAYFAVNSYFRRPDIFYGTLAFSGIYDIRQFTGEYFDENCYYNSPVDFLPNLKDVFWLSFLHSRHHTHIVTGSGEGEHPPNSKRLSEILESKNIRHDYAEWGDNYGHNLETWNKLLEFYIGKRL